MALMMSVSGVRGLVGETLTPTLAAELGCAFGTLLGGGRVVIGRDTRPSGPMIQSAVVAGLLAAGCEPIVLEVASTPAVGLMVRRHNAAGGVVITASHNPIEWNGIKFLTDEGLAPPPDRAQRLYDVYHEKTFKLVDAMTIRQPARDAWAAATHVEATLKIADPAVIASRQYHVVLDSINGAGGEEGKLLLEKLGCKLTQVNAEPTGRFAHAPEPIAENLTQLCDEVRMHKADAGFAQDPDADRLAIVDEQGRFIGEEYTLALVAKYMYRAHPGPMTANLSTSRMVDDLAGALGAPCRVYRSAVGEANVVAAMKANRCVWGGEGNGGVIDTRVGEIRDSLVAMALVLQLLAATGKSISQLVAEIPAYTMIKTKFECSKERIDRVLEAVKNRYRSEKVNDIDGVRVDFSDGWVHIRGSNTEPIIRIIAEARTAERADGLIAEMKGAMDSVC
ncbi:MAG TPA: phosphoglucosamine mutase [Phycisphaerae bacterium]|nr:phosphoglucosamine mutase [Phycisphaerae bacterium]